MFLWLPLSVVPANHVSLPITEVVASAKASTGVAATATLLQPGVMLEYERDSSRSSLVLLVEPHGKSNWWGVDQSGAALPTDLISRVVALMYSDDLALLADLPDDLVVLLGMADAVASKYGLLINAAKTKIMVVGRPMTLPTFKLSGKELLVTDSLNTLGSLFADDGSMSRERWMSETSVLWPSVSRHMSHMS
eukprot:351032-Chlamydomonas_euryale.AAC.9